MEILCISFLCYIKRDYPRDLKKHKSVSQRSRWDQLGSLLRVSQGWTVLLSEGSGEVSTFMFITVWGRIHFPSAVGLRVYFSWLSSAPRGCHLVPFAPSISAMESLPQVEWFLQESLSLLLPQVGKNTHFKGLRPTHIISLATWYSPIMEAYAWGQRSCRLYQFPIAVPTNTNIVAWATQIYYLMVSGGQHLRGSHWA